jgi:RNA polymerase sigma-70 factor (ECF subfamily)
MSTGAVSPIQSCLDRLRAGDPAAQEELIQVSRDRLLLMTRRMLRHYAAVRRWEESDDILQNVLLRLQRTLAKVPLESPRHFLALAAVHIRRELIDLVRHYFGPQGMGANHASPDGEDPGHLPGQDVPGPESEDPVNLVSWREVHEQIAALPDEEREVVDLLWYHGMSQPEAAALLDVSVRTVRRRWQAARLRLAETLGGEPPV